MFASNAIRYVTERVCFKLLKTGKFYGLIVNIFDFFAPIFSPPPKHRSS